MVKSPFETNQKHIEPFFFSLIVQFPVFKASVGNFANALNNLSPL